MTPRRRRLLVASLPITAIALVLAAKLLSLSVLMGSAAGAIEDGDTQQASSALGRLSVADVVEPWKSSFARGDAAIVGSDPAAARVEFERALAAAPDDSVCVVRVNLVLTIEQLAQAAPDGSGGDLLREGLAVAARADAERCPRLARIRLDDAKQRLRERLAEAELPQLPTATTTTEPAPSGEPQDVSQDQLDALAAQQAQSAAARATANDRGAEREWTRASKTPTPW